MTYFTYERPKPWAYAVWFLFLATWMQGMAVLNLVWPVAVLVGLRHLPLAFRQLKQAPWLWKAWLLYEGLRIASTILADHPQQAMLGLFDDLRVISCALLALIFIRDKNDLIRAGWATFAGFAVLAWWSLGYQLIEFGDLRAHNATVIFGTLAHMNYAAAWSMVAMLSMLVVLMRTPFRRSWPMLLGIVPIAIMQLPLGSRTVLLMAAIGALLYIIWHRSWRILLVTSTAILLLLGGLALTPQGLAQFGHFKQYKEQAEGKPALPGIQIRLEIATLIAHLIKDHPLGLGPRNQGYVDLNSEREWIARHMRLTLSLIYQIEPGTRTFKNFDFNHPFKNSNHPISYDPHSQYTATLAETGWPGIVALLLLWGSFGALALRSLRLETPCSRALGEIGLAVLWIYVFAGLTIPMIYQAGGIIFFTMACALVASINMHEEKI